MNIIFYGLTLLSIMIVIVLIYGRIKKKETYTEYPNALVTGYGVAGTVYASYPGNTPGLGWII